MPTCFPSNWHSSRPRLPALSAGTSRSRLGHTPSVRPFVASSVDAPASRPAHPPGCLRQSVSGPPGPAAPVSRFNGPMAVPGSLLATMGCFAPPHGAHPFGTACGWLPRPSVLLTSRRLATSGFASLRSPRRGSLRLAISAALRFPRLERVGCRAAPALTGSLRLAVSTSFRLLAQPPDLPPRLNHWSYPSFVGLCGFRFAWMMRYRARQSLCCASSSHRIGVAGLRPPLRGSLSAGGLHFVPALSGFCSSARRFDSAALRPCGLPSRFSKAARADGAFVLRCALILGRDRGAVSLPLGSSPRSVTLPELASTRDFIFMFPCFGSFTGGFHPIYNAPMLGAHKSSLLTPDPPRVPAAMTATIPTHSRSLAPGQA